MISIFFFLLLLFFFFYILSHSEKESTLKGNNLRAVSLAILYRPDKSNPQNATATLFAIHPLVIIRSSLTHYRDIDIHYENTPI